VPTVEALSECVVESCDLSFVLIGERLRELREAKKWSKRDLQEVSGISRFRTSRIEQGHGIPDIETLRAYAVALGVPVPALVNGGRADDGYHGLMSFAKLFASMSQSEKNSLRGIARLTTRKDVRVTV
jgi:transcriptional regulator with XRE-family HTH domain